MPVKRRKLDHSSSPSTPQAEDSSVQDLPHSETATFAPLNTPPTPSRTTRNRTSRVTSYLPQLDDVSRAALFNASATFVGTRISLQNANIAAESPRYANMQDIAPLSIGSSLSRRPLPPPSLRSHPNNHNALINPRREPNDNLNQQESAVATPNNTVESATWLPGGHGTDATDNTQPATAIESLEDPMRVIMIPEMNPDRPLQPGDEVHLVNRNSSNGGSDPSGRITYKVKSIGDNGECHIDPIPASLRCSTANLVRAPLVAGSIVSVFQPVTRTLDGVQQVRFEQVDWGAIIRRTVINGARRYEVKSLDPQHAGRLWHGLTDHNLGQLDLGKVDGSFDPDAVLNADVNFDFTNTQGGM